MAPRLRGRPLGERAGRFPVHPVQHGGELAVGPIAADIRKQLPEAAQDVLAARFEDALCGGVELALIPAVVDAPTPT
jgi:hypothetical protein